MMSATDDSAETPARPTAGQRVLASAVPAWRQFLVNMKVWAPYFTNRVERERLVRVSAADERVSLNWKTSMPRQCWSCGSEEALSPTEFQRTVRAYENPLSILAGMLGGGVIGLLLLWYFPGFNTLLLLIVILGLGLALLRLKSWNEQVRLVFWSCAQHREQLAAPDMAIEDQQLCVTSPTFELAEAARAAIRAKRKRGHKSYVEESEAEEEPVHTSSRRRPIEVDDGPIRYKPPEPVDLPPIRLADDDDDSAAVQA
jgi:hypothetical protein